MSKTKRNKTVKSLALNVENTSVFLIRDIFTHIMHPCVLRNIMNKKLDSKKEKLQ